MANGINSFAENETLPLEFHATKLPFEPWHPSDSIGIKLLMDFSLAWDWAIELARKILEDKVGKEMADEYLAWDSYEFNNVGSTTIIEDEQLKK
jgi:acyl-homoserine lactone acylase PvdQ